jgi:hypothetical protein
MLKASWQVYCLSCPQCYERNSGRDPFPVFLKRGPLPKEKPRGASLTGRFPKSLCFTPQDFRTGMTISVYGRDFFIHDCDDFTRQWYQVNRLIALLSSTLGMALMPPDLACRFWQM